MSVNTIIVNETLPIKGSYDVIVAGGGMAGIAAALAAARKGANVLLVERQCILGGLGTGGLVNYWVPLCNGRGKLVMTGMAEEMFKLSVKHGYDCLPDEWKNGEPKEGTSERCATLYSIGIFSTLLLRELRNNNVDVLYDVLASKPIMTGNHADGIIIDGKSGRQCYLCKFLIDATGDADLLERAGVPTIAGENYYTYMAHGISLDSCKTAIQKGNVVYAFTHLTTRLDTLSFLKSGSDYKGISTELENAYLQESQLAILEKEINKPRNERDISILPTMPQLRMTRCIEGDTIFSVNHMYQHEDTSIGVICDYGKRDCVYEVPFGTLVNRNYDNLITCGRSAAATGEGWDVLRVIPCAVLTGQAAGTAAAMATKDNISISSVPIQNLQHVLANDGVMIHIDDKLIPEDMEKSGEKVESDEY